ncbi:MAG TPA: hypothetical protein VG308_00615 [Stellaceae bacterium]|jgi:hypothetical protein|nr:hypothetical protein [Stellaceae bacterium]
MSGGAVAAIRRRPGGAVPASGRGRPLTPRSLSIGLSAVIVAASEHEPRVLTIRHPVPAGGKAIEALPAGPLEAEHRTLEIGLRSWVERQTSQRLGYVEQLYTFGDRDRLAAAEASANPALTVAYLALAREVRASNALGGSAEAVWQSWYRYFPWEDWRTGKPQPLSAIEAGLGAWAAGAASEAEARLREVRIQVAFGLDTASWNEELVLERYELLYEAGLVSEAARDRGLDVREANDVGVAMAVDHRRILATAVGRLRGKIKYRPVVFELMPPAFTLSQLQRTVEALSGVRLHKQNFRRLVEQQGLVEETGDITAATGGRPARLVRFRREVLLERPAPGLRLRAGRRMSG